MAEVAAAVLPCLWRLQRVLGAALGVLPVTGDWPPRPWPRGWAYLAAASSAGLYVFIKVLDHVVTRMHVVPESTSASYTTFTVALIGVRVAVERFSSAHMRTAWCELAKCVFLYSRRHPLSRDAWRNLLGSELLGTLLVVGALASFVLFIASHGDRTSLQASLGAILGLTGPLLFGLNYFLVLHPVAVLEALAADLRRDGSRVMSFVEAPSESRVQTQGRQTQHFFNGRSQKSAVRLLRVRQRYLYDIGLGIDSVCGAHRLVFTIFILWISPLGLSHCLIISKPQLESRYVLATSKAVGPAVMVVCYLLEFAHLCILSQLIETERTSLREAAQAFLLCDGTVCRHRDEVEKLIAQIRDQENSRCACVLGMYNFDVPALIGMLNIILTYAVVMSQFEAVLLQ